MRASKSLNHAFTAGGPSILHDILSVSCYKIICRTSASSTFHFYN
jgi:hypothetical protein